MIARGLSDGRRFDRTVGWFGIIEFRQALLEAKLVRRSAPARPTLAVAAPPVLVRQRTSRAYEYVMQSATTSVPVPG